MNLPVIVATALVASIAAGGLLTGGIALLVRVRSFDATARHALWFGTLIALALLPLAGITASVLHAYRAPATETHAAWVSSSAPEKPSVTRHSVVQHPSIAHSVSAAPALPATRATAPGFSIPSGLALAALALLTLVAIAGLVALVISIVQIGAVKRRSSPLDERLAGDLPWLTETHRGRETYLRLSYEIEAPVAIGFNRPVILIPTELATESGLAAIEDLVIHEHAHLVRYDDYTNIVQRAIERIFWFNPFVWIVGRRIALEREMAADDAVVARTTDRTRYADALWRLAREMRMPAYTLVAPGALFTRKQISVRIEALLAPSRTQMSRLGPASAAGALAIGLFSCAIVALAAPPLELPAPPAETARTNADAHSLETLSGLISTRLHEIKPAIQASRKGTSPERVTELQGELTTLRHKLDVMRKMAQRPDLKQLEGQVATLQENARSLDAGLAVVQPTKHGVPVASVSQNAPARTSANAVSAHVNVPPVDVAVPGVSALVPATSVHVPEVNVHVPAMNVRAPEVDVHVPSTNVHVPAVHVDVPQSQVVSALNNDEGGSKSTTLTRDLIARCSGCDLSHRDLRNIDLHGLALSGLNLSKADLRGANLSGAELSGADLSGANLDGANLTNARLSGADIAGASFRGAKMDGVHFEGISLRHSSFDNAGVREILMHGCSGCDLSHMDLRGIDLHGVSLTGADLSHSDLSGANLSGASFSGASFDNADLDHADLRNASLEGCSLHHTSLNGAKLEGIKLAGSSLGR